MMVAPDSRAMGNQYQYLTDCRRFECKRDFNSDLRFFLMFYKYDGAHMLLLSCINDFLDTYGYLPVMNK